MIRFSQNDIIIKDKQKYFLNQISIEYVVTSICKNNNFLFFLYLTLLSYICFYFYYKFSLIFLLLNLFPSFASLFFR